MHVLERSTSIANGYGCRPCKIKQVQLDVTDAIIHFIGDGSSLSHLNASNVDFGTLSTTVFPVSGVNAGTYGSSSNVSQVTIDQYGRVTSAANVAISGGGSSQWTGLPGSPIYYVPGVSVGSSSPATANLQVTGNVYVSNALTTTNVFATLYYGDGGLLSNISSSAITQPFANLVVSNAVTTTNVFAVTEVLTGTAGRTTLNVTGNIYASNAVTTANVNITDTLAVTGSLTANAANATFFFDTFTIPYINTQYLNVSSDMTFTGPLATLANLYIPGNANIEYLSVSNLSVTGNLYVTATNLQTTNALTINNSGTMTAFKVTQNETSIHTHNVAEFWDATTLAMVIDPEGNVAIHTVSSPGYALTVTDPANFETLYIRGKPDVTSLNVTGNVTVSNALTTTNVFATWYYGDGGLLSNISSSAITQPFANLVVSNALTTTNVFTTNVTATGIQTIAGLTGLTSLNVTGNIYASNALTTTNIFAAGFTSNVSNTYFFYSTLTVPFVYSTTLNVASTANVLTASVQGSTGQTSLAVTGNVTVSNAITTTNVFTTNVFATGQVTAAGRTGVGVCTPMIFRQGTAGANWNTPAANTSTVAVTSGAVQMQCGANTMVTTTQFIPFPVSYTGNPVVLVTSYGTHGNIWVASITSTNFSVSANTAQQFEWLSIGI